MLDVTAAQAVLPTWTGVRVELLKTLYADGLSASQIAGELGGITRNAVIGKISRLGLTGRARVKRIKQARNFLTREEKARNQQDRHTIKVLAIRKAHVNGMLKVELVDAVEPIELSVQPPEFLGLTLLQLEDNSCRFPRGDGADITFCGQRALKEQSWCASCARIVYQPLQPRRDNSPAPANYAGPGRGTAWA